MKVRSVRFIISIISILLLCSCSVKGPITRRCKLGMFHGRVVDANTGKPIEGAVAHVTYVVPFTYGKSPEMAVRETLTDANGEYLIPEEKAIFHTRFACGFKGRLKIYKPGYGYKNLSCLEEEKEKVRWSKEPECLEIEGKYLIWELRKLTTREERSNNLPSYASDVPIEQQILLIQAINEERYNLGYELFDLPDGYAPMRNPPSPVKKEKAEPSKQKCKPGKALQMGTGKGISQGGSVQMTHGYPPFREEQHE